MPLWKLPSDILSRDYETATAVIMKCMSFYQKKYSKRTKVFAHHKTHVANCVIYWLSAKLGSKEIEICKFIKYEVSALTWVKISNFLVFREVLNC